MPSIVSAKIESISLYGLADESWNFGSSDVRAAEQVLAKGTQFLGTTLNLEEFGLLRWATFSAPSQLRSWAIDPCSAEREGAVIDRARRLMSYRARQEEYRSYAAQIATIIQRVSNHRKATKGRDSMDWFHPAPFPSQWEVSKPTATWCISGPTAPSLIVAYFDLGDSQIVPDEHAKGGRREMLFDGSIIAIWSIDEGIGDLLGEVAPAQSDRRKFSEFTLHAAISYPSTLPTLLVTATGMTGSMRPINGHYTMDEEHSLRTPIRAQLAEAH